MKLRHLSRIDFFLTQDNEIYLNEVNTFPGMTPISMFPKMNTTGISSFSVPRKLRKNQPFLQYFLDFV
ncbi:hypothetical protein OH492_27975 [Vibrio chagasii]|nr:hypothetical protein [Vibrio chagasii]